MASAQGIKAGAAYVEITADNSKLAAGLNAAARKLQTFGSAIKGMGTWLAGVGAAVTAPLTALAKGAAQGAHDLLRMSQRTGISVEALSELGYAAQMAGSDIDSFEVGIKRMQRMLYQAANGSETAKETLAELGITLDQLKGLSPDQQFTRIAEGLSHIPSAAMRTALAMQIFGRGGTQLLPLLNKGAAGIDAFREEARKLGLTASSQGVAGMAALEETLMTLWKVLKKLSGTLGAAVAPVIKEFADGLIDIVVKATKWLKANQALVLSVFKIAATVKIAGLALLVLGYAVSAAGSVLGTLAGVVSGVVTAFTAMGAVLAWILSPLGLVITAAVALGAYLIYSSGIGGQALRWLGDRFADLSAFASAAFQGISDALAAGDISLAAKVLWLSLQVVWQKGVSVLQRIWIEFSGALVKVAYGAFTGILAAVEQVWHAMKVAWIEGTSFLKQIWTEFATWHAKAVEATTDAMVKAWIWAREKTGVITADEAQFERDYANKQSNNASQQIDKQKQDSLNAVERDRAASRQAESKRHEDELAGIGKSYNDLAAAADAESADKLDKTTQAMEKARQEWKDALAQSAKSRKLKQEQGPTRLGEAPAIPDYLQGLGPTIQDQKNTIGVAGTFNAMEAQGLGAGGVSDRIANATEATAKNTKKLLEKLQEQQAEFD